MRRGLALVGVSGEGEVKCRAFAYVGGDGEGATVMLGDLAADVEAEAKSPEAAAVMCLVEAVEDMAEVFRSDADAVVADDNLGAGSSRLTEGDSNVATLGAVFDGVVEEVGDYLLDADGVGEGGDAGWHGAGDLMGVLRRRAASTAFCTICTRSVFSDSILRRPASRRETSRS